MQAHVAEVVPRRVADDRPSGECLPVPRRGQLGKMEVYGKQRFLGELARVSRSARRQGIHLSSSSYPNSPCLSSAVCNCCV